MAGSRPASRDRPDSDFLQRLGAIDACPDHLRRKGPGGPPHLRVAALAVLAASNGRDAARRRRGLHVSFVGRGANLAILDSAEIACALIDHHSNTEGALAINEQHPGDELGHFIQPPFLRELVEPCAPIVGEPLMSASPTPDRDPPASSLFHISKIPC